MYVELGSVRCIMQRTTFQRVGPRRLHLIPKDWVPLPYGGLYACGLHCAVLETAPCLPAPTPCVQLEQTAQYTSCQVGFKVHFTLVFGRCTPMSFLVVSGRLALEVLGHDHLSKGWCTLHCGKPNCRRVVAWDSQNKDAYAGLASILVQRKCP